MKVAQFNRFEIEMPDEAVAECYHSGSCDSDVERWRSRIDLSYISDEKLRQELREYGAWSDAELQNRAENERRILWLAAADIQDEEAL